jgi:hypothetical protein
VYFCVSYRETSKFAAYLAGMTNSFSDLLNVYFHLQPVKRMEAFGSV